MGKQHVISRWLIYVTPIMLLWLEAPLCSHAQPAPSSTAFTIVELFGNENGKRTVEIARAGAQTFDPAQMGAPIYVGDRIRIGLQGGLAIQRLDKSVYKFKGRTEFVVAPPKSASATSPVVRLFNGILYFLHRGKPDEVDVMTRRTTAAVRGTEFEMRVDEADTTVITMIDGVVDLSNEVDSVRVRGGEQGYAEAGKAPVVRAAIEAVNIIQWALYYPGVFDVDEIPFSEDERAVLRNSIEAYRAGDLLRAVSDYPSDRQPGTDAERVYRAGLLLAVGQMADAQSLIRQIPHEATETNRNERLIGALQKLIGAVKLMPIETKVAPELASEWLAESYSLQASGKLEGALKAARAAVQKSPKLGFGWERVAELEFSFGRINDAKEAVAKALQLSPRNAQALALNGFLFAAQNKLDSARGAFEEAIAIDGRLANAWLGRGLVRIRRGDQQGGREDLLTAAAMEPQRAFLRSYLGKAWTDAHEKELAERELELAKQFDPRDPTAWLYSALLKAENNQVNEAVRELEHAQDLSANRGVYRSEFMLDEDRAVQSVNLAKIYRDAGMIDWSVREAGKAVADDYGNFAAHLFLANSYDQLQDPYRINLRYETVTESEYLIANLLAPVAAGTLSRSVSQGEYSSLFERNRFGVASTTEYLSRGAWYENGAQFGIFGNTAYSIEGIYRHDPGQRPNNDFEERDLRFQIKQQLTYQDSVFVRVGWLERETGDVRQYYDPALANPTLRTKERQEPTVIAGYHHEWNPGVHTLVLGSRLDDTFAVQNPDQALFFTVPNGSSFSYIEKLLTQEIYQGEQEVYAIEAQQIWQSSRRTTTLGGRFQSGDFKTFSWQGERSFLFHPTIPSLAGSFIAPPTRVFTDDFKTSFERLSLYGYQDWKILDQLLLVGGVAYDRIVHPLNYQAAPISDEVQTTDQISPKAGFVWTPLEKTIVRGAYTRSLSGAGVDQSLTIEPTQVAGINQSFRSLISESLNGSGIGARFETFGLGLQQKFTTGTYLGVTGDILYSEDSRSLGILALDRVEIRAVPSQIHEDLEYRERSLMITIDQLIDRNWAVGIVYKLTNSRLDELYPEVLENAVQRNADRQATSRSTLNQVAFHANFNHSCGFFAQAETVWYGQSNQDYIADLVGSDFWQVNFLAGYRFLDRRAEIAFGLLNANDANFKLSPLTPYVELPRDRTFMLRMRLSF